MHLHNRVFREIYSYQYCFAYNHWLYNIFLLCDIGFMSLMFYHLLNNYVNAKPIIIVGLGIILLFYVAEISNHGFFEYNERTYTQMSVVFVIYCLYYFYLLIKDEEYINLKSYPPVWWVIGTLFFYFGLTAVNIFDPKLDNVKIGQHSINFYIFRVLNVILYSCWSYSFICRRWLTTTSKSSS